MLKKLLAVSIIMGFGFKTFAASYGAAGCGLGSIVFEGKNEWYEQVLAATTNGLASQTFSITLGLLNCDANKLASKSERAKVFVAANKNSVVNEIAMGHGESMTVLANIYNCSDASKFNHLMKSNYNRIILDEQMSSEDIVNNLDVIMSESKVCEANLG